MAGMAIKKLWVRSTLCMNGQIGYYGRIVSRASNSKNVAFVFRFWQRLGFIQTAAPVTNNVWACFQPARLAFLRVYGCFLLTPASSSTAAIIVERIGAEVGGFYKPSPLELEAVLSVPTRVLCTMYHAPVPAVGAYTLWQRCHGETFISCL